MRGMDQGRTSATVPHGEGSSLCGRIRTFFARFKRMISIYGERKDDSGKLVLRLEQDMEHLWLFLLESGVSPTNNHAERILRFAVLWRKRNLGTTSERGDRWVQRILSLRQTCRINGRRTFPVLVEAMTATFQCQTPNVGWITALGATP